MMVRTQLDEWGPPRLGVSGISDVAIERLDVVSVRVK